MESVVRDNYGREIHIGDIVFSPMTYDLCIVERFSEVIDRGVAFPFVHIKGHVEPAVPGSLEVVRKEDLDDETRWHDRYVYCGFDVKAAWDRLMRDMT